MAKIDIFPKDPVIDALGNAQQMRIVATYADATTRDVTREAFIESGNTEVATTDRQGVVTAVRRGEAPVLARYEGSYAATTLTVMGDRSGFVWQAAGNVGQDRRTGGRQVAADEDPALGPVQRRRIPPPRLSRPDRSAADGRRRAGVSRRSSRHRARNATP